MKKIYPLIYSDILQYYYAEEFGISRQLAYVKKQHIWINDEYCGRISACFDLRKKFLFLKSKKLPSSESSFHLLFHSPISNQLTNNNETCYDYEPCIDFTSIDLKCRQYKIKTDLANN
jgi:hypothetical protein